MTLTLIQELLIILSAGLVAGLICRRLQVSVLIGYLVVGALLGQGVFGWILDQDHQLEHFTEGGVFLLLFSIGLEFSLDDLRRLGRNLFAGGATQMLLVAAPVMLGLQSLGQNWQSSLLIASAVAFSSTVLVFKALSESGQSERPPGRRVIGILLFQDAALVPLLLMVPMLLGSGSPPTIADFMLLAAISLLFIGGIVVLRETLARWLIPRLAGYRSPELVILFTVVSLGGVTLVAHEVGLPPAVGAFAAGLIFNGNRWTEQIDSLVLPFRETFAAIFFVGLGLLFEPRLIWEQPLLMTSLLIGVLVIKAVAGTIALRITGLPLRHSAGMGVGLAHIGEFAFVLMLLGMESGVVTEREYQMVLTIAVGSLVLTPFLVSIGLRIVVGGDDEVDRLEELASSHDIRHAIVVGAGPIGRRMASQLESMGKEVCLIDLSPINLHPFALEGFRTIAGDATNSETLEFAGARESSLIAICVPDDESAIRVVKSIRRVNSQAKLIVRCRFQGNAKKLTHVGADRVVSEETEVSIALLRILAAVEQNVESDKRYE